MAILNDVKPYCDIFPDCDDFDSRLLLDINTAVSNLRQLGIGPAEGLVVENLTDWSSITTDPKLLPHVKSYVGYKTRMLFDAPKNTSVNEAVKGAISEAEFRLTVTYDELNRKEE